MYSQVLLLLTNKNHEIKKNVIVDNSSIVLTRKDEDSYFSNNTSLSRKRYKYNSVSTSCIFKIFIVENGKKYFKMFELSFSLRRRPLSLLS